MFDIDEELLRAIVDVGAFESKHILVTVFAPASESKCVAGHRTRSSGHYFCSSSRRGGSKGELFMFEKVVNMLNLRDYEETIYCKITLPDQGEYRFGALVAFPVRRTFPLGRS